MSRVAVRMCDVAGCRSEAIAKTLEVVAVAYRDDQGLHTENFNDVDLCPPHEHKYRTNLPEIEIEKKGEN